MLNVLTTIIHGIRVRMHAYLMFVLSKIVLNAKPIQQNVNNVIMEQFHIFQQADVQQQQWLNA